MKNKIVTLHEMGDLCVRYRTHRMSFVWTNGCFDMLHIGHVHSLQSAKLLGDYLIVGVNSDASVRSLKGEGRPFIPASERMEIVAALGCVDFVVEFSELTPEKAIQYIKPEIHCKGEDYAPPNGKSIPEASLVESYGGRIEFLSLVPYTSTTEISRRIIDEYQRRSV